MTSASFPAVGACSFPAAALRSRASVQILCGIWLALEALMEVNAAADGQVLWKYKPSLEIRAPIAVSTNGVVYAAVWDRIKAFDGQTGSERWTSAPLRPDYYAGPVVGRSGNLYVVTRERNELLALNGSNGTILWRVATEAETYQTSLALGPGGVVVVGTSASVRAYDELSGEPRWVFGDSGRRFGPVSTGSEGPVIFGDEDGRVSAISADSGDLIWTAPEAGSVGSIPSAYSFGLDGSVVAFSTSLVRALDPESGARRWAASRYSPGGQLEELLVGEDGRIFDQAAGTVWDPNSSVFRPYELQLPGVNLVSCPRAVLAGGAALFLQDWVLYSVHASTRTVLWKTNLTGVQELGDARQLKVGPQGTVYLANRYAVWAFQGSIPLARTPWPITGGDSANSRHVPFSVDAPLIYVNPADLSAEIGKSLALSVKGLGQQPLAYEWYRNGSRLESETNAILRLETVVAEDHGARFQAVVRNALGAVTSRVATVSAGHALEVRTLGPGTVIKTPDLPLYPPNTQVTLQAQPEPEKRFSRWNLSDAALLPTLSLTITSNVAVTAVFDAQPGDRWWTFHAEGELLGCPAVSDDGTIYAASLLLDSDFTSSEWKLSALDPQTGHEKWNVRELVKRDEVYHGAGTPTLGLDGTLYWGIGKRVLALESDQGRIKWQRDVGGVVLSALALDDEGGVFCIAGGTVVALNTSDGSSRFVFQLPPRTSHGGGITISPSGRLLVGDHLIHELDRISGQQVWEFSLASYQRSVGYHTYPTPSLDGSVQVSGGYGASYGPWPRGSIFLGLDVHDGRFLWRESINGLYASISSIGPDGSIYVANSIGELCALDGVTRNVRWKLRTPEFQSNLLMDSDPAMLASDETAYYALSLYKLYAVDMASGSIKWAFDARRPYPITALPSPVLAMGPQGHVYFGSQSDLFAIVGTAPLATHGWPKFMGNARNSGTGLVDPPQPKVLRDPVSQFGVAGGAVQFRMNGQGRWPLSYQWYRDGEPIAGANGSDLSLSGLKLADAGSQFYVVLSNAFGNVRSKEALLDVGVSLTRQVVGRGQIQVSPQLDIYPPGAEIRISALPEVGREFASWFGDIAGTQNSLSLRLYSNTVVGARFSLRPGDPLWTANLKADISGIATVDDDDTVVIGGNSFQFDNESHERTRVVALDGIDGTALWNLELPYWLEGVPMMGDNGMTYLVCSDDGTKLKAVRTRTGQPVWEVQFGGALLIAPPALGAGDSIYLLLNDGKLRNLDGTTGRQRWQTTLDYGATAIFAGNSDKLYLRAGLILVYNQTSGKRINVYSVGGATTILDANEVIYGAGNYDYFGLQASTGLRVWTGSPDQVSDIGVPIAIAGDGTVFANDYYRLRALDRTTGAAKWNRRFPSASEGSPRNGQIALTEDGVLYHSTDRLNALDQESGNLLWDFREAGGVLGPPSVGKSGNVYVGSSSGKLYAIKGGGGPALSGWSQYLSNSKRQSRATIPRGPYLAMLPGPNLETVQLEWQDRYIPCVLEFTTSPSFPSGWQRVEQAPASVKGRKEVVISRPAVSTFFRLRTVE